MLGHRLIPFFQLFEDGLGHDVKQEREGNAFELKVLIPKNLLSVRRTNTCCLSQLPCIGTGHGDMTKRAWPRIQSNREPPWD